MFLIIHCVDCYVFIFFNVWTGSLSAPLEVVAGLISWSPLEVGTRYLYGFACFSMSVALDDLFWMGFIVPFENISLTESMAANWELQTFSGISLSDDVKSCMACVILSSAVMWGCVRYLCKYSAVSEIIKALFPVNRLYTYIMLESWTYTKSFLSSLVPIFSCVGGVMDHNFTSKWSQGCCTIIK